MHGLPKSLLPLPALRTLLHRQLKEAEKGRQQAQDALAQTEQLQAAAARTLSDAAGRAESSEQRAQGLADELRDYKVVFAILALCHGM